MSDYGRHDLGGVGQSIGVLAVPHTVERKVGGITIDWSTVTALGSDTTWKDGFFTASGKKALRYGQVLMLITASGKFGPYEFAASDGRQLAPTRQNCVILERCVREDDRDSDHPSVLTGGTVFKERLIATSGTHSLAAGPTYTELEAGLPGLSYA